jgi:hypothetical protein
MRQYTICHRTAYSFVRRLRLTQSDDTSERSAHIYSARSSRHVSRAMGILGGSTKTSEQQGNANEQSNIEEQAYDIHDNVVSTIF